MKNRTGKIKHNKAWHTLLACGLWLGLMAGASASEVLQRGVGPEPDALDPHLAQSLSAFNVLRDLNEGLVGLDAHGQRIPAIAKTWSVSADGTVWVFHLDPTARWSDGLSIVAQDFVRSWQRALDPMTGSPTAGLLNPIRGAASIRRGEDSPDSLGVQAIDELTLEVTLDQPTPWFEELLTHPVMVPWRPSAPSGEAVYSGAYQLKERVPGATIHLQANPHYREADQVAMGEVIWHVIEEPSVELARFRTGELHITETIPPGRVDWLASEVGEALRISPYLGTFFLAFNTQRAPFKDQSGLREALSLVIDRTLLTERVLGAGEEPAYALIPPTLPRWPTNTSFSTQTMDKRIERAKALYAQAGYGADNPLTVELRFNTSLNHRRMAAAVGAMWKQHLGIQTRLVNEEWKVFVANRRQGRITEVVRGGWIGDWQDPANFLQLFVSDSPLNYTFYADPVFDALMTKAAGETADVRWQTLKEAESRLMGAHVIIPLYYYVSRHLVNPDVRGFEDNLMDIHLTRWLSLES